MIKSNTQEHGNTNIFGTLECHVLVHLELPPSSESRLRKSLVEIKHADIQPTQYSTSRQYCCMTPIHQMADLLCQNSGHLNNDIHCTLYI